MKSSILSEMRKISNHFYFLLMLAIVAGKSSATVLGDSVQVKASNATNPLDRVGIISKEASTLDVQNLPPVELSRRKEITLERQQIARVLREQEFSTTTRDYLRIGQNMRADGLVIKLVSDEAPVKVFGSGVRKIELKWRNLGRQTIELPIRVHLFQATSATTASLSIGFWKTLAILPGQTILESAELSLPAVRVETLFLAQWLANDNQVLGITKILVYPNDLLGELRIPSGSKPIGVFDSANMLQGILKGFATVNLQDYLTGGFEGKLAIVIRSPSESQSPEFPVAYVIDLARHGAAVIWIQPPPGETDDLRPSFLSIRKGQGTIIVAQSVVFPELTSNPQAQLNLIELARMAAFPDRTPSNPLSVKP